jgi:putative hydrolase
VSPSIPPGGSTPFGGLPFLPDPSDLPPSEGPVNWAVADAMARFVASANEPEAEPGATEADRLDGLLRVAELHVAEVGGLEASTGSPLRGLPVTRGEWAHRSLDDHRGLLSSLATALALPGGAPLEPDEAAEPAPDDPEARAMTAASRGLVFGWMLGQLGRRALGQYDLPLPRPPGDELLLVPANLHEFASDWGLPPDDVGLWVCLHEVAHHAVLARPHVRRRLEALLVAYVSAFEVEPTAFESELDALDPTDAASFQAVLGDPEAVLATVRTPAQRHLLPQIDALLAAVAGWVDHVVGAVGQRLVGSGTALAEAVRRRRVEAGWGDRYAATLLGLGSRRAALERGTAFVAGVVDRAGEVGLSGLWSSERELPTPAEVDAPGLWLARLELDGA